MNEKRIVVDTNVLISFLLLPHSTVNKAVLNAVGSGKLLLSNDTLDELATVLSRFKFDRYVSIQDRQEFILKLGRISDKVVILKRIQACRDPKDDKFLELAVNGEANLIITGDKDLLELDPFMGINILSPSSYLDQET